MPRNLVDVLRTATLDALRDSLNRQMPAGPLRDYYRWGLAPGHPDHRRFVEVTGVARLVRLYSTLTAGLVDDAHRWKLGELLARLAVYQAYEIVSDNVGIGLFGPDAHAPAAQGRRRLVRTFNAAMTVRLRGGARDARVLLGAERRRAARVSTLDQTLARATHRRLAARSAGDGPVEWDLWPALVANVEAAADVVATLDGTVLGPAVRDGLVARYRGVSRTMSDRHLSPVDLAAVGADTVLVVPTLAYCVAVVGDLVEPLPRLSRVVDDGTLADALHGAALLSRLLNDAGSRALRMSRRARRDLVRRASLDAAAAGRDLGAALTAPEFTRLAKDLAFGEFNICLYGARRAGSRAAAFEALESDLDYFAGLYATHRARLAVTLDRLTARLGDPRPATLVRRFVRFHAALYANPHGEAAGEYAV